MPKISGFAESHRVQQQLQVSRLDEHWGLCQGHWKQEAFDVLEKLVAVHYIALRLFNAISESVACQRIYFRMCFVSFSSPVLP